MLTVILVAHIIVSIVLIAVVLMQRSEGGALGIGGGGGGPGGGLVSGTGMKGALIRTTIIFGAIFFVTSLGLTTISTGRSSDGRTDLDVQLQEEALQNLEEDDLGVGAVDDFLDTGGSSLLDDPLAAPGSTPSELPETDADDPVSDDPLQQ